MSDHAILTVAQKGLGLRESGQNARSLVARYRKSGISLFIIVD